MNITEPEHQETKMNLNKKIADTEPAQLEDMYIDMFTEFKNQFLAIQQAYEALKKNQASISITYKDGRLESLPVTEPVVDIDVLDVEKIEFNFDIENISDWLDIMDVVGSD